MITKRFEVRDRATMIPVIAISLQPSSSAEVQFNEAGGFGTGVGYCILIHVEGQQSSYDPYKWNNRTMFNAHQYIKEHFNELPDNSVVDVRVILGEAEEPAESEIWR